MTGVGYLAPWKREERAILRDILTQHGLVRDLNDGATPAKNETPIGVGALLTFLENHGPSWYLAMTARHQRRLIACTMHDMGYIGHTKAHGGRISSWVRQIQEGAKA